MGIRRVVVASPPVAGVVVVDVDGVALRGGGGVAEAAAGGLFCGAGSATLLIFTIPQRSR